MAESIIGAIVIFLLAILPSFILGYLISYKGNYQLIAGWNADKLSEPEYCGKLIGLSLIWMSAILTLLVFLWLFQLLTAVLFSTLITFTVFLPVLSVIFINLKFRKRGN